MSILIVAAVSFADEKGILRYAGEKVEVSKELLDAQNNLCETFDLPKHTVLSAPATVVEVEEVKDAPATKRGRATVKNEDDL